MVGDEKESGGSIRAKTFRSSSYQLTICACRHHILYPLQLGSPFPNDVIILKSKVDLGPNQMKIDLRKVFMKNITYF